MGLAKCHYVIIIVVPYLESNVQHASFYRYTVWIKPSPKSSEATTHLSSSFITSIIDHPAIFSVINHHHIQVGVRI